jgi:nicotinamidase-related amidase
LPIDGPLRNLGARLLVVCGIATDMCVEMTDRDAADHGFDVIVVEDATATSVHVHHEAALSGFARTFGWVWGAERVLEELAAAHG